MVLKALEEARQAKLIGTSLEARVRLQGYQGFEADLPSVFIVSQVVLEPGEELRASIERADGVKCERCWKYSTAVGQDAEYPTVCDSCSAALQEIAGMNPRLRTASIAAAVVVIDRVTENVHPVGLHILGRDAGDPGILQHRPHRESRRGVRNSGGFPQPVEQHAAGGRVSGGDGDHRRDAVAPASGRGAQLRRWYRWVWRWYSAARWATSGIACFAAR